MPSTRKDIRDLKATKATKVDRGERSDHGESRASGDSPAYLVVIYGPELGRRVVLGERAFEIGRTSKADLAIDQESVSRVHARVTWNKREHSIEDMESTNGTFVNDMRVLRVPLTNGDQIKVGRSILKYMAGTDLETSYHEEIYRLMTMDALTGAHNRRYFNEAMEREYNRAIRYRRALSLIVFDIDRMTAMNDRFGHVAGDSVIRQLAQVILPRTREQDILARIGGQDFALLLPEVDRSGATAVAEKVRRIAELSKFSVDAKEFAVTLSVGVASLEKETTSAEVLLARATGAVKQAKARGRNRVD